MELARPSCDEANQVMARRCVIQGNMIEVEASPRDAKNPTGVRENEANLYRAVASHLCAWAWCNMQHPGRLHM